MHLFRLWNVHAECCIVPIWELVLLVWRMVVWFGGPSETQNWIAAINRKIVSTLRFVTVLWKSNKNDWESEVYRWGKQKRCYFFIRRNRENPARRAYSPSGEHWAKPDGEVDWSSILLLHYKWNCGRGKWQRMTGRTQKWCWELPENIIRRRSKCACFPGWYW